MPFCPYCGNETYDILKSCPTCGAPTSTTTTDGNSNNKDIDAQDQKQLKKVRYQNLKTRVERYKCMWNKDSVVQFKSDSIAILQRKPASQVEFIIAFEDLTKQGYELKVIDTGKETSSFSYSVDSFYYFQRFSD